MKLIFKDGTGIELAEDVDANRFLIIRHIATIPGDVKDVFLSHNYNLSAVPGIFLKMFTVNAKELTEVNNVLNEIDSRGLQEIFNANLSYSIFKREFLNRVVTCLDNNTPFLNSDNTFASFLYNSETFNASTIKEEISAEVPPFKSVNEAPSLNPSSKVIPFPGMNREPNMDFSNESPLALDTEDLTVKAELLKSLLTLREECNDGTLKFIITSVIANLDTVIANDNKMYKTKGTRHIIKNAMNGISITPEMQEDISSVLSMFPEIDEERGLAA